MIDDGKTKDPVSREMYWQERIALWKNSGQSIRGYCETQELKKGLVWVLGGELSKTEKSSFVELALSLGKENGIQVLLPNSVRLVVDGDFDEQVLKKLVSVLGSI